MFWVRVQPFGSTDWKYFVDGWQPGLTSKTGGAHGAWFVPIATVRQVDTFLREGRWRYPYNMGRLLYYGPAWEPGSPVLALPVLTTIRTNPVYGRRGPPGHVQPKTNQLNSLFQPTVGLVQAGGTKTFSTAPRLLVPSAGSDQDTFAVELEIMATALSLT